jgi:putative Mg2+ transporter-C (MgtC) family protein
METGWSEALGHPIFKILLSIVLSGVIGYEREISDKPAGLRTNILIGLGSTLMMMISIYVSVQYGHGSTDPARIAAQVVAGIGFLGAGTILHARGSVVGLTTAATIWAVAGIGLAVGSGLYFLAVLTTTAILAVLWVLGRLERRMFGKHGGERLRLKIGDAAQLLKALQGIQRDSAVNLDELDVRETEGVYSVELSFSGSESARRRAYELLLGIPGVQAVQRVGSPRGR